MFVILLRIVRKEVLYVSSTGEHLGFHVYINFSGGREWTYSCSWEELRLTVLLIKPKMRSESRGEVGGVRVLVLFSLRKFHSVRYGQKTSCTHPPLLFSNPWSKFHSVTSSLSGRGYKDTLGNDSDTTLSWGKRQVRMKREG